MTSVDIHLRNKSTMLSMQPSTTAMTVDGGAGTAHFHHTGMTLKLIETGTAEVDRLLAELERNLESARISLKRQSIETLISAQSY